MTVFAVLPDAVCVLATQWITLSLVSPSATRFKAKMPLAVHLCTAACDTSFDGELLFAQVAITGGASIVPALKHM
jgi:hypothetical protein